MKFLYKNKYLIFILSIILIILVLPLINSITCSIVLNSSCTNDEQFLFFKNDTSGYNNAHGALINISSTYPYVLCCNSDDLNQTINNSCDNDFSEIFLRLSNTTNAHVQLPSINTYLFETCIAIPKFNINFNYNTSCTESETCLFSISNTTNAHIANCSHYTTQVCLDATFNNTPPYVSAINISPSSPNTTTTIYCNFTIQDTDLMDTLYANYSWLKNGVVQEILSGQKSVTNNVSNYVTLLNTSTTHFENWSCNITPYDSYQYGNSNITENVTILNLPPSIPELLLPTNGNQTIYTRDVNFTWASSTDIDEDSIYYIINLTNQHISGFYENTTNTSYIHYDELNTFDETLETLYFWKVKACDEYNNCSDWSELFNFSIEPVIWIEPVVDEINFGEVVIRETYNTLNESYPAFEYENYGNSKSDLYNITAEDLWLTEELNTSYFQAKANYTGILPYNESTTKIDWFNISNGNYTSSLIYEFDYHPYSNKTLIDVQITVPEREEPGNRSSTLTFFWRKSQ